MSRWHSSYVQTLQLCPRVCSSFPQLQLTRSLQSLTYTGDSQLMQGFHCIPKYALTGGHAKYTFWFWVIIVHGHSYFIAWQSLSFHAFKEWWGFFCVCDPFNVGRWCYWKSQLQCWWLLPSAGCPFCLTPLRPCRCSGESFQWLEACLRYMGWIKSEMKNVSDLIFI